MPTKKTAQKKVTPKVKSTPVIVAEPVESRFNTEENVFLSSCANHAGADVIVVGVDYIVESQSEDPLVKAVEIMRGNRVQTLHVTVIVPENRLIEHEDCNLRYPSRSEDGTSRTIPTAYEIFAVNHVASEVEKRVVGAQIVAAYTIASEEHNNPVVIFD